MKTACGTRYPNMSAIILNMVKHVEKGNLYVTVCVIKGTKLTCFNQGCENNAKKKANKLVQGQVNKANSLVLSKT